RMIAIVSAIPAVTMPIAGQPMSAASAKAPAAPATYDVVSRNATPAARDPRSPRRLSNRPSQTSANAAGRAMTPSTTSGFDSEPAARPMKAPQAATRNAPPRYPKNSATVTAGPNIAAPVDRVWPAGSAAG